MKNEWHGKENFAQLANSKKYLVDIMTGQERKYLHPPIQKTYGKPTKNM